MSRCARSTQDPEKILEETSSAVEKVETAADADVEEIRMEGEAVVVMPEIGLNLRSAPLVDAPILEVIPEGAVLQVIPLPYEEPGWCPVVCGQVLGWVDRRYIETLAPAEEG